MKFNIAVVQFAIEMLAPEKNIKKAEDFIKRAAVSKADIILFPEDFVTGPIDGHLDWADSEGKYIEIFQKLARKYRIDIVPGTILEADRKGLHNTCYYIDSSGEIKGRYRKINLWHTERRYLTPGNEIAVFNTRYGKVGLIICWDLAFPEIFRKMVLRGVNIVLCPSYWTYCDAGQGIKYDKDAEIKFVDSLCSARAFENEIILVYCNAAGQNQCRKHTLRLIGHSQIAVPFKGAISKLEHNKEDMFIQEVDTDILKTAERTYRIRKDLKSRVLC